jgi:type IV secretory pathway VirJ component
MKKVLLPLLALVLAVGAATARAAAGPIREETFSFGKFGKVTVYRASDVPKDVVLFVSGDGGWNLGVVDMARELASLDAAVIGIDITHFLRELQNGSERCLYPAADFEALSQYAQKKLGYTRYSPPVLVGYSSGATLVYAALVQAPPSTFAGAISLGFCPDLLLSRPMCRGDGLESHPAPKGKETIFEPARHLNAPWYAFQGLIDQVCDPEATRAYVAKIPGAAVVELPKVGHGFSVPAHWMKQFRETFQRIAATRKEESRPPPAPAVADLPLIEVPAALGRGDRLAVILSGDGGWASIDRSLGEALAAEGIPVVGWNSLQYFWTPKTPETGSADLERILRHYLDAWGRKRVLLIGYSMGAEALPFYYGGLPEELRQAVDGVVLLGPGKRASFEFHLTYWLGGSDASGREVLPELGRIPASKLLCVYGEEEREGLCAELTPDAGRSLPLKGAHHFGGEYKAIVGEILAAFPEAR